MSFLKVEDFMLYPIKVESLSKLKAGQKIKRRISARFSDEVIITKSPDLIKKSKKLVIRAVKQRIKDGVLPMHKMHLHQDEAYVNVGFDCALKIMIRYLMLQDCVSLNDLASMLYLSEKQLKKQLSFKKSTDLQKLSKILHVLGYKLNLSINFK